MSIIWRQSHSCLPFLFLYLSAPSKWESWISPQCCDELFGDPIVIQMGCQKEAKCSFLPDVKIDLKISNLEACFQCQTAEWLARKMDGVPVKQIAHFLLYEDSAIKKTIPINNLWQWFLIGLISHWQGFLFCFVLWTRKNSLTGWACEIRELLSQRIKFPNTLEIKAHYNEILLFIKRELNQWPFTCFVFLYSKRIGVWLHYII